MPNKIKEEDIRFYSRLRSIHFTFLLAGIFLFVANTVNAITSGTEHDWVIMVIAIVGAAFSIWIVFDNTRGFKKQTRRMRGEEE